MIICELTLSLPCKLKSLCDKANKSVPEHPWNMGIITENRKYIYYVKPRIENSSTALWLVTGLTLDKLSSKRTNVSRLPPLGTVTFCENHRSIIVMWVGVILYKSRGELIFKKQILTLGWFWAKGQFRVVESLVLFTTFISKIQFRLIKQTEIMI